MKASMSLLLFVTFAGIASAQTAPVVKGETQIPAVNPAKSPWSWQSNPQAVYQDANAYLRQGVSRYEEKKYKEAVEAFSRAISINPHRAESYRRRGAAKLMLKDLGGAAADASIALAMNPQDALAHDLSGRIREVRKDYHAASKDYEKALAFDPSLKNTRVHLAAVTTKMGHPAKAAVMLDELLRDDPSDRPALEERAYTRLILKDYRGAIEDFDALIVKTPEDSRYYHNRGAAKMRLNDIAGARQDFEKALQIDPDYETARKNLARLPQPAPEKGAQKKAVAAGDEVRSLKAIGNDPPREEKVNTNAPDIVPFALKEPLDINALTATRYHGAVSASMETMRLIMGDLSPEDEQKFSAKWAAYFDFPTEESVAYFNRLNPLLSEFLSLRAAIATAAVEFDGAWEEAVIAAGYESEDGIREALSIAESQKNQLLTMQARLVQIVKMIEPMGNPPDPQEAKAKTRKKHEEAIQTTRKAVKAAKKRDDPKTTAASAKDGKVMEPQAKTSSASPDSAAAIPAASAVMTRDAVEKLSPQFAKELSSKDIDRIKNEIMQGRAIVRYYCTSSYCEGRVGGTSDGLIYRDGKHIQGKKFGRECTPDEISRRYRMCDMHGNIIGTVNLKDDEKKLLPAPPPAEAKEVAVAQDDQDDEEWPATDEEKAKRENIAFHTANIRIIEKNLAKDEAERSAETDPIRRAALDFRILAGRSDIQAEKDLVASLQTGRIVHTRTPFDDYAQAQFIGNIRENQRRMEDFLRTTAALNRLAGMLPAEEAESARAFIKRQVPLESMANLNRDKAKKVAEALGEKVQGYYLSAAAGEDEKAAWANFGMEAAQNIKTAADAGMTAASMLGGRGMMVAYQGVTGYVEGGPVEAVSRAAYFYSTPAAVAADAFKGYQEGGWQGAAKNAATAYISRKAFEYGAQKVGGAARKGAAKSNPTVQEQFAQSRFKEARQDGESLTKAFSRAQGELDRLGKTGAAATEIIKQQKAVRGLAASVNASPHAKNFLKYRGDYHSQRAYNAHMKSTHADVEAGFHEEMLRRGWNRQELKEFRNSASAGSVGMDHDIGLVEKPKWIQGVGGKVSRNDWLTQNGKSQTVEQWQKDAQKAWDKCYHDTTGRNAKQAWETVTTSVNLESYRDLNLLGADKSRVQAIWAQQSGDVTRYKMHHMLKDPALSKMEAFQEVSRGAAKDMSTKLIPLMEQATAQGSLSGGALADAKRHWQKVQSVLDAFGRNDLDPISAQRRVRELTGKSIPEVVDDASVMMESMIKGMK